MYEIKNRTAGPVQLVIRSRNSYSPLVERKHSHAFTCLNIPGFRTVLIEDERIVDKYLEQCKTWKLLSYRQIPDKKLKQE